MQPLSIERFSEFSLDPNDQKYLANTNYLTKVLAAEHSPFDVTLFLDADTLVVGDIQPLMDAAVRFPVTVTEFSGWTTTDEHYQSHFTSWKELAVANPTSFQLKKSLEHLLTTPVTVINTGVFTIHSNADVIEPWKGLASLGRSCNIPDEICLLYTSPSPRDQRGSRMPSSA